MAGELIGGAFISGAIQLLLEKIASPEVVTYLLGNKDSDFEALLKRLRTTVSSLTGVLDDAEQRQIRDDPRVERWLDDVQEALFDAEDLLEDIETDALQLKRKGELITGSSQVREAKRQKIFDIFSWSSNSTESDGEIKMKKILARLEEIVKQKEILGLRENLAEEKQWQRPPSTSLLEECLVYGRDADKEALIELLVTDDNFYGKRISVVPVVGMAGVGKTTLVQTVFNHPRVKEHFDLKFWVCVSESYDALRVTKTILRLVSDVLPCDTDLDLNSLQVKLRDSIAGKKFLIVLDDFWNDKYTDWEVMRIPFHEGARGSKIIVTTRSEEVARITGNSTVPTQRLDVLTEKASWQLFSKQAFGGFTKKNAELERIGREILKKCGRLPLAVKTLGGLLHSKLDIDHWEGILASEIWELTDNQSAILPALRLSYHYLPSHLKRCFTYCAIFPKDYEFDKEELILLWMAQNLLEQPKGNKKPEEVGNQYFNQLVSMSFFRPSERNRSRFIMHDLIVDLATFVSRKYTFRLENRRSGDILIKETTRHLSCIGNQDIFNSFPNETRLQTFLLLNFRFRGPPRVSKTAIREFFSKMKYLKALSLSRHCFECRDLLDSVCGLKHLRFLNLSYTSVKSLPDSLCMLYSLQTLKLAGCDRISKLPEKFHHLVKLRYLDASYTGLVELPKSFCLLSNLQKLILNYCLKLRKLPEGFHRLVNLRYLNIEGSRLKEMPTQISKLKMLETLSSFVVGNDVAASIRELGNLSNLRGALCIKNIHNVIKPDDAFEAKLREKKYLNMLKFEGGFQETNDPMRELGVLDNLVPHTSLIKLEICYYGGARFPEWLGHQSFCNVEDVYLSHCNWCGTLPPLGNLSSLKTLRVERFDAVVSVGPEFYGMSSSMLTKPFPSLEVLSFNGMPNWEQWFIPDRYSEAFPKLTKLAFRNCDSLEGELPRFLPSLTELSISSCKKLVSSLPTMPKLARLALHECSESIIRSMEEALESSSSLQSLAVTGNSHSVRFRHLSPALQALSISSYNGFELQFQRQSHDSLVELSLESLDGFLRPFFASDFSESFRVLESQSPSSSGQLCEGLILSLHITSYPDFVLFPNIRILKIKGCKNLELLLREGLLSLSTLQIVNCPDKTLFSSRKFLPNLTCLTVRNCTELKFLPENMKNLFPVLNSLNIADCNELASFPTNGLPLSLRFLTIRNCDKLVASRGNWKLQSTLHKLTRFTISGYQLEDMKTFPEQGLLPTEVTQLSISAIKGLKSINDNELRKLASLARLTVSKCPNLVTMIEEKLPSSLEYLRIHRCPLLLDKSERVTEDC